MHFWNNDGFGSRPLIGHFTVASDEAPSHTARAAGRCALLIYCVGIAQLWSPWWHQSQQCSQVSFRITAAMTAKWVIAAGLAGTARNVHHAAAVSELRGTQLRRILSGIGCELDSLYVECRAKRQNVTQRVDCYAHETGSNSPRGPMAETPQRAKPR